MISWLSKKQIIFARISDDQKLIITQKCKAKGDVVAVVGDDIGDIPAIKASDFGVTTASCADMTKEAAECILLQDDFSNLITVIEQAQKVYRHT